MKPKKKQETYWLSRNGIYCLWDKEPIYSGDVVGWEDKGGNDCIVEFCAREFEKLCPSAKLKPGGIMKIRGFKVIKC